MYLMGGMCGGSDCCNNGVLQLSVAAVSMDGRGAVAAHPGATSLSEWSALSGPRLQSDRAQSKVPAAMACIIATEFVTCCVLRNQRGEHSVGGREATSTLQLYSRAFSCEYKACQLLFSGSTENLLTSAARLRTWRKQLLRQSARQYIRGKCSQEPLGAGTLASSSAAATATAAATAAKTPATTVATVEEAATLEYLQHAVSLWLKAPQPLNSSSH